MRQPQALQASRTSACTTAVLNKWFYEFDHFLHQHDLLDKPSRIWNCGESGFPLRHKSGKVLAPQGAHNVYHITGNNKQQITTLCCISATGGVIPPRHIYPGERFGYNFRGWSGRCLLWEFFKRVDDTGALLWMDQQALFHSSPSWTKTVCLLIDGHSSHIDLDTSKFCAANEFCCTACPLIRHMSSSH